jgi:hypothetical protein
MKFLMLAVGIVVGVVLTVLALYPALRETRRNQRWGLLLSPEEIKAACGNPQADDGYKLTYVGGDRHVELQFMGVGHKMYLRQVKWNVGTSDLAKFNAAGGSGEIRLVTSDAISDYVKSGNLPACLGEAAR